MRSQIYNALGKKISLMVKRRAMETSKRTAHTHTHTHPPHTHTHTAGHYNTAHATGTAFLSTPSFVYQSTLEIRCRQLYPSEFDEFSQLLYNYKSIYDFVLRFDVKRGILKATSSF